MQPAFDMLLEFGPKLIDGEVDALAARYALPCVVAMSGAERIIDDPAALQAALDMLRAKVLARGICRVSSRPLHQVVMADDLILVRTETDYFDASDKICDSMRTTYLLRQIDGQWKILTLTIDRPISGVDGLCLPLATAA